MDPADAGRQTETVLHVSHYDFMSTALNFTLKTVGAVSVLSPLP